MADEGAENPGWRLADGLRRGLRGLWAAAVDTVYPPVCAGCGRMTGQHRGVCSTCWATLRLIERPYCEVLGLPFSHDLGAGILSADAIANPPVFERLRSVAVHDGIAKSLVHGLKYRDRTDLAVMMAEWMIRASDGTVGTCDAIVPVPLHAFRLWGRKFNQSAELARAIARSSGKPFLATTLIRNRRTAQQVGLGASQREENVRGAFSVTETGKTALFGKRIVLVDDVYTTGATVSAATRALKKAGAVDVTVLTFARAMSGLI